MLATHTAGLVKSADLLTPLEPDAGTSAPNGNSNTVGNGEPLAHGRIWSGPLKLLLPAMTHRGQRETFRGRHTF